MQVFFLACCLIYLVFSVLWMCEIPFWKDIVDKTVLAFVRTALPGVIRIGEVIVLINHFRYWCQQLFVKKSKRNFTLWKELFPNLNSFYRILMTKYLFDKP